MFYEQALSYIKNLERGGSDYGIERMRELLALLSDPDLRLRSVHVAGTNGKGSVTAYLTSVFLQAGLKVGTYNSPSTLSYNERWLYMGKPLSDEQVAKYMTVVKDAVDAENLKREENGKQKLLPTAFETETALALVAFCDLGVDICVLETGLGGRWDATNAIRQKELAVITSIGFDHCELLGDTLGKIAAEKAAIIDGRAVTIKQCDEVMRELEKPYLLMGGKKVFRPCELHVAEDPVLIRAGADGQEFLYKGKQYRISMLGSYQLVNAALAIEAAKLLKKDWDITDEDILRGMRQAKIACRFEVVKDAKERFDIVVPCGKTLVFDGAHNPHGMAALKDSMEKFFPQSSVHLVIGVLRDKDYEAGIRTIAPVVQGATAVSSSSSRAMKEEELCEVVNRYLPCDCASSVREGIIKALSGDCDVVLVAGSLSLFCEVKEA